MLVDGITGLANVCDFVLGTVGDTRVGHGVTVITIGEALQIDRAILNSVSASPLNSFFDHEDILSLNLESWDLISSSIELCVV